VSIFFSLSICPFFFSLYFNCRNTPSCFCNIVSFPGTRVAQLIVCTGASTVILSRRCPS
jgi:hypothetical protein